MDHILASCIYIYYIFSHLYMKQFYDDKLGKIIVNKLSEVFDIEVDVTYNVNMGFFQSKYSGVPHLMEHLICRYYEMMNKNDNT